MMSFDIISTHLHVIIAINVSFYNCTKGENSPVEALSPFVSGGAEVDSGSSGGNFTTEQFSTKAPSCTLGVKIVIKIGRHKMSNHVSSSMKTALNDSHAVI